MRLFGRVALIVLAVVGSLTLLLAVAIGLWTARQEAPPLPAHMVLSLDLNHGLAETRPDSPLARLQNDDAPTVLEVVRALDRAADDPRVGGLLARLDGARIGMAQAQELRAAVARFRASGKRTLFYSSGLGEGSAATIGYYLASAFQQVWLQPSGDLGITGFMAESPFLKGLFDKLGITAQFGARWEYKSAIEIFTRDGMSKANQDSLSRLVRGWTGQIVAAVAHDRGLTPDQVRQDIDQAPLMADEALKDKLVDKLAYWDEVQKSLLPLGQKFVAVDDYAARLKDEPNAVKVALIMGVGTVQRDGGEALSDGPVFSARRLVKAFEDAAKDPKVKAILFRIDSPGGSYPAADAVWRAVGQARAAGKPVVVSMGDVAASGGYFAALPADRIFADPGTITGSIGVFSGKFVAADLWKKVGVSWGEVPGGANAGMWSSNQTFSPAAWARLNVMLDHVYADFTGKAEQARHIAPTAMDALARGRIWTGADAAQRHLVDGVGGYDAAWAAIRDLVHVPSQMPLALEPFPRPRDPMEELLDILRTGHVPDDMAASLAAGSRTAVLLERLQRLTAPLTALMADPAPQTRMPPLAVH